MTDFPKIEKIKINVLYAILQGFYWCCSCAYFGFLVLFLRKSGYKDSTIGVAMMVLATVTIISSPVLGYLSDYKIPIKKIFGFFMLITIPISYFLKFTVHVVPLAILSIAAIGLTEKSIFGVLESWGMKISYKTNVLNYGAAKSVGSMSYAFTGLFLGSIYDKIGIESLFPIHAVIATLCFIASLFNYNVPIAESTGENVSYIEAIKRLFRNRRYRIVVICMALVSMSLVTIYTFQPILIANMGGNTQHMGIAIFVYAFSEVPFMFFFSKIASKFRLSFLLSVCYFFVILRVLSSVLAPNLTVLLCVQAFQAISYGLYLPSVLMFLTLNTEDTLKSSGITIAFALSEGLAAILGNAIGSVIAEFFGIKMVFYVFLILPITAFLLFTYKISLKDIV